MTDDLKELIASLASHEVEFLLVGSMVLGFYARARYTEDIDVWLRKSEANMDKLHAALSDFGLPVSRESLKQFLREDRQMIVLGAAPSAIDLLNFLGELDFESAWKNRQSAELWGTQISILGLEDFIEAKKNAGRKKDLLDLALLEEVLGRKILD